jgi:hypothetical protein
MPFRHGKPFRLSRPRAEPSYAFAMLHLSDPRITAACEYNPAMLALLLDLPGCAISTCTARPDNKIETVGLERMIEQVEILNGLPRDTERSLLVAFVAPQHLLHGRPD